MSLTESQYFALRRELIENTQRISDVERKYMDFLVDVTFSATERMESDFGRANDLLPFWKNDSPKQRGCALTGNSIPWSELGEKSLSFNILRAIAERNGSITFPGLPFGGDARFATSDALVHFDIKMTGPKDRTDEVVAPPQHVSGDGLLWRNGIINSPFRITSSTGATINFQPKLPPFYVMEGALRLCLTYFLGSMGFCMGKPKLAFIVGSQ